MKFAVPKRVEAGPLPRCAAIRALKEEAALIVTIGSRCLNVTLVLRVNRQNIRRLPVGQRRACDSGRSAVRTLE